MPGIWYFLAMKPSMHNAVTKILLIVGFVLTGTALVTWRMRVWPNGLRRHLFEPDFSRINSGEFWLYYYIPFVIGVVFMLTAAAAYYIRRD